MLHMWRHRILCILWMMLLFNFDIDLANGNLMTIKGWTNIMISCSENHFYERTNTNTKCVETIRVNGDHHFWNIHLLVGFCESIFIEFLNTIWWKILLIIGDIKLLHHLFQFKFCINCWFKLNVVRNGEANSVTFDCVSIVHQLLPNNHLSKRNL